MGSCSRGARKGAKPAGLTSPERTIGSVMLLKFSKSGEVLFEDRSNFRAFKLVVEGDRGQLEDVRRALTGKAELADAETAWIFQDALRSWPGVQDDAAWQQNFSTMIEK